MRSDDPTDDAELAQLFDELLATWRARRQAPPDLLAGRSGVVLAGAGKVGGEFLAALREAQVPVFGFADNNSARWGQTIAGLPVWSATDAVQRYGSRALFIVTIGRVGQASAGICKQFSDLGADAVLHFIEAIPRIPAIWRQFFLDPDAFAATDLDDCLSAWRLFRDRRSRDLFAAHLRWRATLDPSRLPTPEYDNQYFPVDLVAPRHCATFVDVGAYTGDTLAALTEFAGDRLEAYYGFEPDPRNYEALVSAVRATTARRPSLRIVTDRVAIGAVHGQLSFAGDGAATSQVTAAGSDLVACAPLDAMSIAHPTYVKIDVEGAEDAVLTGGVETLRRWKPSVAIATYHRPKDLFALPLRLAEHASDYRFHLRSHGDAGIDLVCYAVREPEAG